MEYAVPRRITLTDLNESFVELIRRAATDLPVDVEAALRQARDREAAGSAAEGALDTVLENVSIARQNATPICQDTGVPIFNVRYRLGLSPRQLQQQIMAAVVEATERSYLRPNAVDPLTGRNSGNNLGRGFPTFHFEEWGEDQTRTDLKVDLLLKGGGSENVGAQYKLPHRSTQSPSDTAATAQFEAGRDLDGVRKVVLDAVYRAQGKGCAPGVLGVAVGGDRGSGYVHAKEQLFRPLDDVNPEPALAELEETLLRDANALGIGPMGFGGETTLFGVKVGAYHRLPACYFVSIAYNCWALRRATMVVEGEEVSFR